MRNKYPRSGDSLGERETSHGVLTSAASAAGVTLAIALFAGIGAVVAAAIPGGLIDRLPTFPALLLFVLNGVMVSVIGVSVALAGAAPWRRRDPVLGRRWVWTIALLAFLTGYPGVLVDAAGTDLLGTLDQGGALGWYGSGLVASGFALLAVAAVVWPGPSRSALMLAVAMTAALGTVVMAIYAGTAAFVIPAVSSLIGYVAWPVVLAALAAGSAVQHDDSGVVHRPMRVVRDVIVAAVLLGIGAWATSWGLRILLGGISGWG